MLGKMKVKKELTIPNVITSLRIVGTVWLMFTVPFSRLFYVIYTFCGVTDVLDGWIARRTKSTSEFGAKLDSIADLMFYSVMVIKIFPFLWSVLPIQIWMIVGVILLLRLISYVVVFLKYRRFAAVHTYANKLTGAGVFSIPYLGKWMDTTSVCSVICIIAMFATVEELFIHVCSKAYRPNVKTIFNM